MVAKTTTKVVHGQTATKTARVKSTSNGRTALQVIQENARNVKRNVNRNARRALGRDEAANHNRPQAKAQGNSQIEKAEARSDKRNARKQEINANRKRPSSDVGNGGQEKRQATDTTGRRPLVPAALECAKRGKADPISTVASALPNERDNTKPIAPLAEEERKALQKKINLLSSDSMNVIYGFLEDGGDEVKSDDELQLTTMAPDRQRALAEMIETQEERDALQKNIELLSQARMDIVVNFAERLCIEAGGDMPSDYALRLVVTCLETMQTEQLTPLAPDRQRALAELVETQLQGQLSGAQGTESESEPPVFPVTDVVVTDVGQSV